MTVLEQLQEIRQVGGAVRTPGLSDEMIKHFAEQDALLGQAVEEAVTAFRALQSQYGDILARDEEAVIDAIQHRYVNFYPEDAINPYVTLAARGPWIVTAKGAVLHDNGGYGMLGMGHGPEKILEAMNQPHVMANIMTANFSQLRLVEALDREIGHARAGNNPFDRFLCMNSGSEAVTVAARIADVNAKIATDQGGPHAGKPIRRMALSGGFHGRTDRPAQFSDSSLGAYAKHLASFRDRQNDLVTVEVNNVEDLKAKFAQAEADGVFIEGLFIEPVMGEGNPGMAITPEFYQAARELTREHGTLLLVDSIQAGLRATGCLSIVDYPGFEKLDGPDMESYSKALNAGQYPLSVLAMNDRAASLYRKGIYGNTMTANPRAMDVGTAVLESITDDMRQNIRRRGEECLEKFKALQKEMDGKITKVQGTGLLFSCELQASEFKCYGANSTEEYMRTRGLGVIHGGENSLRFTPHFAITSEEVDLMVDATHDALKNGPRKEMRETG
ncbi:acetylornithine/succinyldiaminopimelate/putrescine aminotransferase [Natronospira proteinivora]|uniref:Acetylornithine/succinyldiaminopimelate/putresci ne aminotransferase n=1 Tax=Natronospira proteinivora TaxID=1807133 RepID=A0ABT1GAC5_9GAMM|nr:aminotransferase class III-fold pyridoxal phosphate-dependent enzyme [Natronospira proteinivora]MCP1728267.1 acetylornithine/succinyldiaminopimelate/putrescine aminotransferase [Natronospira proteinivora]